MISIVRTGDFHLPGLAISGHRNIHDVDERYSRGEGNFLKLLFSGKKTTITDDIKKQFDKFQTLFNNKSLGLSAEVVSEKLGGVDESIIKCAKSCKNGELTFAMFEKSLGTTTLSTLGLTLATTALNAALSMGIAFTIQGIVSAVSDWAKADEITAEKAEELTQKLKEQREEDVDVKFILQILHLHDKTNMCLDFLHVLYYNT